MTRALATLLFLFAAAPAHARFEPPTGPETRLGGLAEIPEPEVCAVWEGRARNTSASRRPLLRLRGGRTRKPLRLCRLRPHQPLGPVPDNGPRSKRGIRRWPGRGGAGEPSDSLRQAGP